MKLFNKHKKTLYTLLTIASAAFILGFFQRYHLPKIKVWLLTEIESKSHKISPIRIWPESVDFHLFPVGATFYNVKLLPRQELKGILSPTKIDKLTFNLSAWGLAKGQLRLGLIEVDGGAIDIHIQQSASPQKPNLQFSMKDLALIPIEKIALKNIRLNNFKIDDFAQIKIDDVELAVQNEFETLKVSAELSKIVINKVGDDRQFDGNLKTDFFIDDEGIYFSQAELVRENSFLSATGSLTGHWLKNQYERLRGSVKGQVDLDELNEFLKRFLPNTKIPNTLGLVNITLDGDYNFNSQFKIKYLAQAEKLKIDQFNIGRLQILGETNENGMSAKKLRAESNYGRLELESAELKFNNNFDFKAKLTADQLKMHEVFSAIGLPNIPLAAQLNGQLPCSGQFKNPFQVDCNGQIIGSDLLLTTGATEKSHNQKNKPGPFTIVAFKKFGIVGSVHIDAESVKYKTQLSIGSSKGESSGIIDYQKGFKIAYSSPEFNFADIEDLASLKPEGQIKVKGTTEGTSETAIIDLKANGENLWLSDFYLGQGSFNMKYRKGLLYLTETEGLVGSSRFKGDITINLLKNTIEAKTQMPFVDIEDMTSVFSRKVTLPFSVRGTGSATVNVSGPLQFNLLSYDFKSAVYRGAVAGETFDQLQFNVVSTNGYVKSKNISLRKGRSHLSAVGQVNPDAQMNLLIKGYNFQLEQSENLSKFKTNTTGNLNFEMALREHILHPHFKLKGRISDMAVGDSVPTESTFTINKDDKVIEASGSLLGSVLNFNIKQEFDTKGATHFDVKAKKWNIAQTFSIFSESLRSGSYQTAVTGEFGLSIPNTQAENFSAKLDLTEFTLRNNKTQMSIQKPISLRVNNGIVVTDEFDITGANTYLRLKSNANRDKKMDISLEGRIDLSLASLFTPFLDELGGVMRLSFNMGGTFLSPTFNGSAFIENGLVKIRGVPHPLEQITGDAIFNNEKIILNSMRGKIGGGQFTGGGQILVKQMGLVPIDVRGTFQDAKFNIPEGFQTRGSGDYFIRGDWLPYVIGINYYVDSGSIDKRTFDNTDTGNEIKPSSYLPKYISEKSKPSVLLDIDITLKKQLPVRMIISRIDIRTDIAGAMKVEGPPESPELTGKIYVLRGGKITFRNNVFEVKSGTIEYAHSAPDNPGLNVQAEARVTAQLKDNKTRDYDIDMKVAGTAKDPKITLSSQPPLPENELLSLITLGYINESTGPGEDIPTGDALTNTSYQLGSAFISEQLGINRVLEDRLGVRFDINSSYDATDKAARHEFTLKKQWTPKFGTTASREIGKTSSNSVKAEYKLNKNVSVIGEWEGKEPNATGPTQTAEKNLNTYGVDLEYKVDFK